MSDNDIKRVARRTAFVDRFIFLREGTKSKANKVLKGTTWETSDTAEDLKEKFLEIFQSAGDKKQSVKKDLEKAYKDACNTVDYFTDYYAKKATVSFEDALEDYEKSNKMLFDSEEVKDEGKFNSKW